MRGKFDRIICDPPFLSSDCQTKGMTCIVPFKLFKHSHYIIAALTVRWLLKTPLTQPDDLSNRIIVCTGERVEELVLQLYPGIHPTSFEPQHAENRLSNAFRCYADYECEEWTWR